MFRRFREDPSLLFTFQNYYHTKFFSKVIYILLYMLCVYVNFFLLLVIYHLFTKGTFYFHYIMRMLHYFLFTKAASNSMEICPSCTFRYLSVLDFMRKSLYFLYF